jgi:hypothetical protein
MRDIWHQNGTRFESRFSNRHASKTGHSIVHFRHKGFFEMSKARPFKLRFNLSPGPHFMHWVIVYENTKTFVKPDVCTIAMSDCVLKNQPATAQKIFDGADKSVCAWIECKHLAIYDPMSGCDDDKCVGYNPRIAPYWRDSTNTNIDNAHYDSIVSIGRSLQVGQRISEFGGISDVVTFPHAVV